MKKTSYLLILAMLLVLVGCGSSSGSSKEKVDLYQYRLVTEDKLVEELGFEKNDMGMYPSEDDLVIMCDENGVYSLVIMEKDKNKYTFLGISIGDDYNEAKEKIEKCYTFYDSSTNGDSFEDFYKDNQFGSLAVDYNMESSQITRIAYSAENLEAEEVISEEDQLEEGVEEPVVKDEAVVDTDGLSGTYGILYEEGARICNIDISDDFPYIEIYDEYPDATEEVFYGTLEKVAGAAGNVYSSYGMHQDMEIQVTIDNGYAYISVVSGNDPYYIDGEYEKLNY